MSKFFITNSSELFRKIKTNVEASEYKTSFEFTQKGVYALSTKKLAVDNTNGIECGDGFIIVTGTMAWDKGESINRDSLRTIYDSFSGDVDSIRKKTIGNFASCIYCKGMLYVFGEIIGFYNIYYYNNNSEWLVSNSLFDTAIALKEKISINKLSLTEASIQDGLLLDDTYFNEIKRLSGYNYIEIQENELKIKVEPIHFPLIKGRIEEKVGRYVGLITDYAKNISEAYGAPAISMTGGLDARMVMSSYLASGVKPHLYYGTGNSFITNTYSDDKKIDEAFVKKYELVFYDEKWNTPSPFYKFWEKNISLYGFHYDTYAGSDTIFNSIRFNPSKLFTYGYCGELLRNLPWIEAKEEPYFTIDEYIDKFYVPKSVRSAVVDIDDYLEYIKKKLVKTCELYNLDVNHISNEDIFYLSFERRKTADSHMLNLVNMMKYCCYTLGQYETLQAARVTTQEAANSSFMLRCLDKLYPSVLEIPVFSHCTYRTFNRESMSLNLDPMVNSYSWKSDLKMLIKNKIPKVVSLAKKATGKQRVWRFPVDEQICQQTGALLEKYDTFHLIKKECFEDKNRLIKYLTRVYALNYIKNFE